MILRHFFNRKNNILLKELIITDFKLRYQGSVLGYAWSIIKPLFLFAIMFVVFTQFLGVGRGIPHYPVALLLGIVMWNFFMEATSNGLNSIVSRGDLIRKINFPKYIIVISGTVSSLINLFINLVIVLIFALIDGVNINFSLILIVPLIIELYMLSLGLALFLAALNVKFRDIGYLWEIFSQALFYASPIIYPLQLVVSYSSFYAGVLILSPIAQPIQEMRALLVGPENVITLSNLHNGFYEWIPYIATAIVLLIGIWFFNKNAKYFAESI